MQFIIVVVFNVNFRPGECPQILSEILLRIQTAAATVRDSDITSPKFNAGFWSYGDMTHLGVSEKRSYSIFRIFRIYQPLNMKQSRVFETSGYVKTLLWASKPWKWRRRNVGICENNSLAYQPLRVRALFFLKVVVFEKKNLLLATSPWKWRRSSFETLGCVKTILWSTKPWKWRSRSFETSGYVKTILLWPTNTWKWRCSCLETSGCENNSSVTCRLLKMKSLFLRNGVIYENSSSLTSQLLKLKAVYLRKVGYVTLPFTQRNFPRRPEPSSMPRQHQLSKI